MFILSTVRLMDAKIDHQAIHPCSRMRLGGLDILFSHSNNKQTYPSFDHYESATEISSFAAGMKVMGIGPIPTQLVVRNIPHIL